MKGRLHFCATFQLSPAFLRQKYGADHENHSHFSEICTVLKIYEELGIPDFGGENEISRFSCHFLFEKVCLGVKKCISKLGILLPFHRCTEMFRWVNLSAKKVTYKIENQGGKCHVFANPRANNPSHTPVSIIFWDENVVLITNIAFIYLRYLPFEIYII
jgi:hypothetical protein